MGLIIYICYCLESLTTASYIPHYQFSGHWKDFMIVVTSEANGKHVLLICLMENLKKLVLNNCRNYCDTRYAIVRNKHTNSKSKYYCDMILFYGNLSILVCKWCFFVSFPLIMINLE